MSIWPIMIILRVFITDDFTKRNSNAGLTIMSFPIGLFIGDIDGFKEYNDTYGHSRGDKILTEVSKNLRALVGHDATLARIGGDEFALFYPEEIIWKCADTLIN